ncbi:MAG: N-acetylmuramoyl-L-alanine amidase [Spirosomataceae bacterium]
MLKVLKVIFLVILTAQIGLAQNGKLKTIVIDAGHGGKDPGTHRGSSKEKNIALSIALKLGKKIEEGLPDIKVIQTRKKDVFIDLSERAAIANRNKADLFICIHVNANPHSSKLSGTEIYTLGLHRTEDNLELAKRENEVILMEENYKKTYKGYDPNSPLAHIMMANFQNAFMKQSVALASKTSKKIASVTGLKNRGVKQAGFIVLWQTSMPAIYVETGYITNPTDKKFLDSESGREKMAEAIFQALKAYKEEVEKK